MLRLADDIVLLANIKRELMKALNMKIVIENIGGRLANFVS